MTIDQTKQKIRHFKACQLLSKQILPEQLQSDHADELAKQLLFVSSNQSICGEKGWNKIHSIKGVHNVYQLLMKLEFLNSQVVI